MIPSGDESGVEAWLDGLVVHRGPRGAEALLLARALVEALGHPQRQAPAVHIVGTAGKGTFAALLTGRLVAAGVSVVTHQSPHVHDVRERFLVDGRLPEWSDVTGAARAVARAAEVVRAEFGRPPTYFAVTAAMSWELGRRHDIDVFVTEAGIGGRFDATSVLDRPDTITAITEIGLDHLEVLGTTVEAIATEKVSVLEGRRFAVLGRQSHPAVRAVARATAARNAVILDEVSGSPGDWREDAEAAVTAVARRLSSILERPIPIAATVLPPGRYEVVEAKDRRVVLDGAHNPLKLSALARVIAADTAPSVVVAAIGSSKDLDGCAAVPAGIGALVVATEFGRGGIGPRSHAATDLAAAIGRNGGRAEAWPDISGAARRALELTSPGDTILVTGSFLILAAACDALRTD
jgi:dihydrofolate synthase / folylpolyglutamate synthase